MCSKDGMGSCGAYFSRSVKKALAANYDLLCIYASIILWIIEGGRVDGHEHICYADRPICWMGWDA